MAGASLFAVDKYIKELSHSSYIHSKAADYFFMLVHAYGMGWEYIIATALLAGFALIYKKRENFIIAGELIGASIAAGIVTQGFKLALGRLRPYQSQSPFSFFDGGASFFSGDVVTAFTFAVIMSKEFPRQNLRFIGINRTWPLMAIITYFLAGMVALQRLYSNNHWASDVYYGILTAYAAGIIAVNLGQRIRFRKMSVMSVRGQITPVDLEYINKTRDRASKQLTKAGKR